MVVLEVSQITKAEKSVNDKKEDDEVVLVGGVCCQMAEAVSEFFLEPEVDEQALEQDEAGEQGEWLFVELDGEGFGSFSLHIFSATFHGGGFL